MGYFPCIPVPWYLNIRYNYSFKALVVSWGRNWTMHQAILLHRKGPCLEFYIFHNFISRTSQPIFVACSQLQFTNGELKQITWLANLSPCAVQFPATFFVCKVNPTSFHIGYHALQFTYTVFLLRSILLFSILMLSLTSFSLPGNVPYLILGCPAAPFWSFTLSHQLEVFLFQDIWIYSFAPSL